MRTDDDVHLTLCQLLKYPVLLGIGAKSREQLDLDREGRQTLNESLVVLLRKDRGRDEHRDLRVVHDGFEGGAQGDLGLAIPCIATDEAVHGAGRLHILFDGLNGLNLVIGFGKRECGFELTLPLRVGLEGAPVDDLAGGVEIEEFGCQLRGCPGNARLGLLPAASSQPAEVGSKALGADIARQAVCLVDGNEELVAPCIGRFLASGKGLSGDCAIAPRSGVLKVEVFTVDRIDAARDQSAVDTNAVVLVDDDVARLKSVKVCSGATARRRVLRRGSGTFQPKSSSSVSRW